LVPASQSQQRVGGTLYIERRSESLLDIFSVHRNVETSAFLFLGNAKSNGLVDDVQDDEWVRRHLGARRFMASVLCL
jgi:hypothetical protein